MIDASTIIDYKHEELLNGIDAIFDQIIASGFEPDYIVGIVRGGAVPATYLSHKMKTQVFMLPWSKRDNHLATGNHSNDWIAWDINAGSKVLLVDDIVDGGDTIRDLLADWNKTLAFENETLNMDNIRLASLWYNSAQETKVDFYHHEIDRNIDPRWIIFPWEVA